METLEEAASVKSELERAPELRGPAACPEATQLSTISGSVKEEMVAVKEEGSMEVEDPDVKQETECGLSTEAAMTDLYPDHECRGDLVLGPVGVQLRTTVPEHNEITNSNRKRARTYSEAQVTAASEEVLLGMSIYQPRKRFQVPESGIRTNILNNAKRPRAITFSMAEEQLILDWVDYLEDSGFPIGHKGLLKVARDLKKDLNGYSGKLRFQNFAKRYQSVASRVNKYLFVNDATEATVREWFDRVSRYLTSQGLFSIIDDPRRVFNCEEIAFYINPTRSRILRKRIGDLTFSRVDGDHKECLTVLVNVSANGDIPPAMVVFPYTTMPKDKEFAVPSQWGVGHSQSGWLDMDTFYHYITKVFYPWLKQTRVTLPIFLFLNGHTSYISLPLSLFCRDKGIVLLALPRNATEVLQPLDVAACERMQEVWPNVVKAYRAQNNATLKRKDFAREVQKCFDICLKAEYIKIGFRCCGLHPFNPNSIDYQKALAKDKKCKNSNQHQKPSKSVQDLLFIKQLEDRLPLDTLKAFIDNESDKWTGDVKYVKLFEFWKKFSPKPM